MTSLALATLSIVIMLIAIALALANIATQLKLLNGMLLQIIKDIKGRDHGNKPRSVD